MAEYINRAELIENLNKFATEHYNALINQLITKQPTADVQEVRHGHWILLRESEITGFNPEFAGRDPVGGYICSICKNEAIYSCNDEWVLSDFCPHCGAIMCKDVK